MVMKNGEETFSFFQPKFGLLLRKKKDESRRRVPCNNASVMSFVKSLFVMLNR